MANSPLPVPVAGCWLFTRTDPGQKVIPILRCRNINTDVLTMKTFYIRFPVVENLAGFGCRIQTGHKLFSV